MLDFAGDFPDRDTPIPPPLGLVGDSLTRGRYPIAQRVCVMRFEPSAKCSTTVESLIRSWRSTRMGVADAAVAWVRIVVAESPCA